MFTKFRKWFNKKRKLINLRYDTNPVAAKVGVRIRQTTTVFGKVIKEKYFTHLKFNGHVYVVESKKLYENNDTGDYVEVFLHRGYDEHMKCKDVFITT